VSTGHARRSARIAALGIALVATALGACGDGDDPAVDTTTTDSTRRSTSTSTTSTITSAPTTTTTVPVPAEPGDDVLADGQHVVYLSAIDEAAPTVTVDLVELLTGQAAVDAYREDTGEALDGEQFYLRDRNDLERTLPVDAGAGPYSIIDAESCCDPIEVGFAGLVAVRDQVEAAGGADAPFTLTVQGGVVTSAVQLYLP
jgi:hypothetical protein